MFSLPASSCEISRFESLFLGFGLQTAFAMLTDNERIAKQERDRYWGAESTTLLRTIAAKLDRFDKVAIATTWTGLVPGSMRSDIGNYPILAHPDFYTPDMTKMVEDGDRVSLTMHTRRVANDVLQNVEEARNGLRDDTDKLWQLDGVITQAKQLLGIAEGSIFDRLIKRKLERIHANELFRSIVLGALAIGLGLLTGGTGALAVTAAAGLAAISVAGAVQSWQRYSFTSAAHGSAIDPARALTQVDPSGAVAGGRRHRRVPRSRRLRQGDQRAVQAGGSLMLAGEAAQTTEQALRNETHDVVKSNNLRAGRDIVSEEAFVASVMDSAERHASQKAILTGDAKLTGEVRSTLVGNRLEGLARDDAMVSGLVALGEDTARAALRSFGHEPELLGRLALLAESEPVMAQGIAKLRGSLGDAAFENIMRDALIRRDPGRVSVLVVAAGADRLTAEQLAGLKRVAEDANAANRSRAIAGELEHTLPQATGLHAPGSQAELAALESTRSLETGSKDISAARLADEMAYVEHSRPLPINQGEYVAEVVLPNGHVWRRNRNGDWCRFSNGGWCLANEGLTQISGRVTRAERELDTIAPLDWPVYRIDPAHPPDIVPPGVVLETPTGERYFRTVGEEGGTVMESVLGPSARRRHYERRYNRRGEMGGDYAQSTMELAHPQGAGTHAEALFGITPAPRDMNQTLQNLCAEEFLRGLQRVRRPTGGELLLEGIEFHQITVTKKWPLSPNLREIEYRIDLSSSAGRRRGFEISLQTSDNTVNARALIGKTGYISREIAPLIDEVQLAYRMRDRLEAILARARAAQAVRAAQRRRRVP